MKTRIIAMIVLTIAALALLLGLKIGRKNAETEVGDSAAADSLVAKRVFNLIILDESGSMSGLEDASPCFRDIQVYLKDSLFTPEGFNQDGIVGFYSFSSPSPTAECKAVLCHLLRNSTASAYRSADLIVFSFHLCQFNPIESLVREETLIFRHEDGLYQYWVNILQ